MWKFALELLKETELLITNICQTVPIDVMKKMIWFKKLFRHTELTANSVPLLPSRTLGSIRRPPSLLKDRFQFYKGL